MLIEIIGYSCALLVGISLGILGSGGSMLTVPIMVYLLSINPMEATGYSLFVVGITSAVGCVKYLRKKLVDVKMAVIFAAPSILSVFLTRKFLVPLIPNPVFTSQQFVLSKELFIIILFALLMIIVAYRMIRHAGYAVKEEKLGHPLNYPKLFAIGFVSGILTGVLGIGGGFIIVPALVLVARVPIQLSVGTSLFVIAFNSLVGFSAEFMDRHAMMDYKFLILFTALSALGTFVGFRLTLLLNPSQIRRIFAWFVLVVGVGILVKEIIIQ